MKSETGSSGSRTGEPEAPAKGPTKENPGSLTEQDEVAQRNERHKPELSSSAARLYRPSRSNSSTSHVSAEHLTTKEPEMVNTRSPVEDSYTADISQSISPQPIPDAEAATAEIAVSKSTTNEAAAIQLTSKDWVNQEPKGPTQTQNASSHEIRNTADSKSANPSAAPASLPAGSKWGLNSIIPEAHYSVRPEQVAGAFPPPTYSTNAVPRAEDFHRFYWKCITLKSELIRLDFALRSVVASGLGIKAANDIKYRLRHLRDIYGINTAVLFPKDINTQLYTPTSAKLYLDRFPACFSDFAKALDALAKALNDFNDVYHDEELTTQIYVLHERFESISAKLESSNIDTFERKVHVQCFLTEWVEPAIESLIEPVRKFHEKGISMIGTAQQNKTSRYFDMTTIATFLSGVTASMIQATVSDVDTAAGVAANTFFFSSLVFSIGSAVNSLLVMSWRRSVVREPDGALKLWFKTWLNMGPMISLIISGAFFSVALCLSAFSTRQHLVTSCVTIGFSGVHAGMLLILAILHLKEKWRFRRKAGYIGRDLTEDSIVLTLLDWMSRSFRPWTRLSRTHTPGFNPFSFAEKGPILDMHQDIRDKKDSVIELLLDSEDGQNSSKRDWNALADESFYLPFAYQHGVYSSEPPVVDILATPNGSVRHIYRSSRSPSNASSCSSAYARFHDPRVRDAGYERLYRQYKRSRTPPVRKYYSRSPSWEGHWRSRSRSSSNVAIDAGAIIASAAPDRRGRSPEPRRRLHAWSRSRDSFVQYADAAENKTDGMTVNGPADETYNDQREPPPPPDGFIPVESKDGRIRLPPPHEMTRLSLVPSLQNSPQMSRLSSRSVLGKPANKSEGHDRSRSRSRSPHPGRVVLIRDHGYTHPVVISDPIESPPITVQGYEPPTRSVESVEWVRQVNARRRVEVEHEGSLVNTEEGEDLFQFPRQESDHPQGVRHRRANTPPLPRDENPQEHTRITSHRHHPTRTHKPRPAHIRQWSPSLATRSAAQPQSASRRRERSPSQERHSRRLRSASHDAANRSPSPVPAWRRVRTAPVLPPSTFPPAPVVPSHQQFTVLPATVIPAPSYPERANWIADPSRTIGRARHRHVQRAYRPQAALAFSSVHAAAAFLPSAQLATPERRRAPHGPGIVIPSRPFVPLPKPSPPSTESQKVCLQEERHSTEVLPAAPSPSRPSTPLIPTHPSQSAAPAPIFAAAPSAKSDKNPTPHSSLLSVATQSPVSP